MKRFSAITGTIVLGLLLVGCAQAPPPTYYGGGYVSPSDYTPISYPLPTPVLISTPYGYGTGTIIPSACSYCPVLIDID